MAEYIDKVAFNCAIREAVRRYPNSFYNGLEVARQIAHDFPAADVRPVVRGRWEKGTSENGVTTALFCSCCHYENRHWYEWSYCPNCGADMREES